MFIITYPEDAQFLQNDLVELARRTPKYRQLHDLLQALCADARVQLAMRHDLVSRLTHAARRGAPALPANVTGWVGVLQVYPRRVPNFRTIQNREAQLTSKTIRLIDTVAVVLGQRLGVTRAERLRLDGSGAET